MKYLQNIEIIKDNTLIVVVGLGYVGLPLAKAFSKYFKVLAYDNNSIRLSEIKDDSLIKINRLTTASESVYAAYKKVFIVTVPTPVLSDKSPDLSFLEKASTEIGTVICKGDIVIYESTTYPGCTEEFCIPVLEKVSQLKLNVDFGVGYSPERISPGDASFELEKLIKVTSGSDLECARFVDRLYRQIIPAGTYPAESIKIAESAKLIENCQRDLNISFMNELVLIFDHLNIDTQAVLAAASTKPNFLNFKPGLVGGHCIGVDPYYMIHKSESVGYSPQVIGAGRKVNDQMGKYIAQKCMKLMVQKGIPFLNSRALILGFAYKANCSDYRNTKIFDIYNELQDFGIKTEIIDPLINKKCVFQDFNIEIKEKIEGMFDLIIIALDHLIFKDFDASQYLNEKHLLYKVF